MLRHDLHRRWLALAGLALVIVLGGGATLGALVLAQRTDRVWAEYVDDARVADLVVNPSLSTLGIGRTLVGLPQVLEAHRSSWFLARVVPKELAGFQALTVGALNEGTAPWAQVLGSPDGRFTASDRPVVTEGRLPSGRREVFVALGYRERLERDLGRPVRVGSTIPVAFFSPPTVDLSLGASPDDVIAPIAVEHLRVSGFGRLPDDVLPDQSFPNERLVVSGDVARRYSCRGDLRADMSRQQAYDNVFPAGCSRWYDYYALRLKRGARDAGAVRAAFADAAQRLSADIPTDLSEASYYYVPQNRADLDRAVARTTRPTVVTLLAFAAIAALATVVVFVLTLTRMLASDEPTRLTMHALGASRATQTRLALSAPLLAVAGGTVGALAAAAAVSRLGPVGSVGDLVPEPVVSAPAAVLVPAGIGLIAALLLVVVTLNWSAAKVGGTKATRPGPHGTVRRITSLRRTGRPPLTEGVRAGLSRRAGGGAIAGIGCAVAMVVVIGAGVFDANLVALSNSPARYGWPWDVAVITGAGYGNTNVKDARTELAGHAGVRDFGFYGLDPSVRVAGEPVATLIGFRGSPAPALPILSGRMARRHGEAVLGTTTADELGVAVGDHVRVASDGATFGEGATVDVVGIAVLPTIGAFRAGRSGLGVGAYVRSGARPNAREVSLTGIRLRPGVDRRVFAAQLPLRRVRWDTNGGLPVTHTASLRPPEIATADSLRAAPATLGVALGIALLVGLTLVTALSIHDRRRDLAIMRAVGFDNRALHATVAWQSLTIVAIGIVVGVPIGVLAGRVAWRAFAGALGIVPSADVPVLLVAGLALGIAALTLAAAAIPARIAARVRPASELHGA